MSHDGALLAGRVAVVTGAARGNGAAIAIGLARAGAYVVLTDVLDCVGTRETIVAKGGQGECALLDITDEGACVRLAGVLAERSLRVSILVNNAGILLRGRVHEDGIAERWSRTLGVNVDGTFKMTRALLPALRETKGTIVNIASIMSFVNLPGNVPYSVSKAAVAQLTRALAAELGPSGIRVNAIAPGVIETEMSRSTIEDARRLDSMMSHIPMQRVGQPEELVEPVIFLASPRSSYVTGCVMPVDGGYLTL